MLMSKCLWGIKTESWISYLNVNSKQCSSALLNLIAVEEQLGNCCPLKARMIDLEKQTQRESYLECDLLLVTNYRFGKKSI